MSCKNNTQKANARIEDEGRITIRHDIQMNKERLWSWGARQKQINADSRVGDIVNVGYIKDLYKYNYEDGIITRINKYKEYPTHDMNNFIYNYQVLVKFNDGTEISW